MPGPRGNPNRPSFINVLIYMFNVHCSCRISKYHLAPKFALIGNFGRYGVDCQPTCLLCNGNTFAVSDQPCVEFISRTSCIFGILRSGICSHRQNLLRFSDDGEADAADPAQCLAATIFMPFVHVCGGIWMHLILFVS